MKKKIIWCIVGITVFGVVSYFCYSLWYDYHRNNGTKYAYYDDGTIMVEYTLKNGNFYGKSIEYYPNGQIEIIRDYNAGEIISYYENGELKDYYFTKNGNEGYIRYYPNEQLKEKYYFKGGKLDGPQYEYYENGNLKKLENYKNGELIKSVSYDENGNQLKE